MSDFSLKPYLKASNNVAGVVEIATDTNVVAGTVDKVITCDTFKNVLGFSKCFESPELDFSSNSTTTFNTGVTKTPKSIELCLICKVAINGYQVGDLIDLKNCNSGHNGGDGYSVVKKTTGVIDVIIKNLRIIINDAGLNFVANDTNFKLIISGLIW